MTDSTRKIHEGTVIAGTHLDEDLIPTLYGLLEELDPSRAAIIHAEYAQEIITASDPDGYFVNEVLFDALDALAPEGMTFSAHPGDGSDYGFWKDVCEHDCDHYARIIDGIQVWYCGDCDYQTGHVPIN